MTNSKNHWHEDGLEANDSKQITVQLVWEGHTTEALRANSVNNLDTISPGFYTLDNK